MPTLHRSPYFFSRLLVPRRHSLRSSQPLCLSTELSDPLNSTYSTSYIHCEHGLLIPTYVKYRHHGKILPGRKLINRPAKDLSSRHWTAKEVSAWTPQPVTIVSDTLQFMPSHLLRDEFTGARFSGTSSSWPHWHLPAKALAYWGC